LRVRMRFSSTVVQSTAPHSMTKKKQVDEEANSCYFAYGIRCLRQLTTASRRRNLEFRLFNKEPTTN
ncbi:hypothetical protein T02_3028, partial [Trichinella nativa]